MKALYFLQVIMLLLLCISVHAAQLTPLSFTEQVLGCEQIIEGVIQEKEFFYHDTYNDIFTRYTVQVTTSFKGDAIPKELSFISRGGILNDEITLVCPSFTAAIGQKGLFFFQKNGAGEWILFNGEQSFISYAQMNGLAIRASYHQQMAELLPDANFQELQTWNKLTTIPKSSSAIQITDFAPKVVRAGQREQITITGSGFGNNPGILAFHTPDAEQTGFIPVSSPYIISWSDTQIKAYVPGSSGIGTGAGTGSIYIQNTSGENVASSESLTVISNKLEIELQSVPLVNQNGNGGITMQYNNNFAANSQAVAAFERALDTWRCQVGFNLEIGSNTSVQCDTKDDGVNVINFDGNCTGIPSAGLTSIRFTICGTTGDIFFKEADMLLNQGVDWHYGTGTLTGSQLDFESTILHELGHLFGLWHVLDEQSIMNPELQTGTTRRGMDDDSRDVALLIAQESTQGTTCGTDYPTGMTLLNLSAPQVTTSITSNALCGMPTGSITANVTGGTSYLWSNGTTGNSVSNLAAGTYSLTVSNNSGCSTIKEGIVIADETGPESINLIPTNATCGNNNGQITANVTGGQMPYSYLWSNGATTASINNVGEGSYTVTVTDANDCKIQNVTTIGNLVITSIDLDDSTATCGMANGAAVVTNVIGGQAPYTYDWSNGDEGNTAFNLGVGTYTVTVTDANTCTFNKSITITGTDALSLEETTEPDFCEQSIGRINTSVSGGRMPYQYIWSNGATSANIQGLSANTYQVTITDADNCTLTESITVNGTSALAISSEETNATCGQANGASVVAVTGGTSPYTYQWSATNDNTASIDGLSAGTYRVTVTDVNDCSIQKIVNISESSQMIVSKEQTDASCDLENGTATISVSDGNPPYSYTWSDGLPASATQNQLAAGTYTVTISDSDNCNAIENIVINAIPTVSILLAKADATCGENNGRVSVSINTGTAPYSYNWEGFPNAQTVIENIAPGTYKVTVTDANDCQAIDQITVEGVESLSLSITETPTTCGLNNGALSVAVTGGTMPYDYNWNTSAIEGAEQSNIAPGVYAVTVTDALGCTAKEVVTFEHSAPINLLYTQIPATCGLNNGTGIINAFGGNEPFTYLWENGVTTQELTDVPAGVYEVTVTDNLNCMSSLKVIVESTGGIDRITFDMKGTTCGDANGSITAVPIGGTPPYTYQWSNGASTALIEDLIADTYWVTVTDSTGCVLNNVASIGNASGPTATANTTPEVCGQANGTITLDVTAKSYPLTYTWSEEGLEGDTLKNLTAGNYSVTITDRNDCSVVIQEKVNAVEGPTLSFENTNSTCNTANGSITSLVTGGIAPFTYLWSNNATSETLDELVADIYSLTVTDANGCTVTAETQIVDEGGPTIQLLEKFDEQCDIKGSIEITHSGGIPPVSYLWSNGATGSNLNQLDPGSYGITITDANGCKATSSYQILAYNFPRLELTATGTSCGQNDGSITSTVSGNSPFSYFWDDGSSEANRTGLAGGTYALTITDVAQCFVIDTIEVPAKVNPIIEWEQDTLSLPMDSTLTLDAGNEGADFLWSTGETTQQITVNSADTYSVTVTNSDTCSVSASVVVENQVVEVGWEELNADIQVQYYPNPADHLLFIELKSTQYVPNFQIALYNLEGKKVRETTCTDLRCNISMEELPTGVYLLRLQSQSFSQAYKVIIK